MKKIKIDEITEEGIDIAVSESEKTFEAATEGFGFKIVSPVVADVRLMRAGGEVEIDGNVKTDISLDCSRCLKKFPLRIDSFFTVRLVKEGEEKGEKELARNEMDVAYFKGEEIDLLDILLEQISLEAPGKPLCGADCKGLCSRCGADLNKGTCRCPPQGKTDPRFAKLKGFKLK